MTKATKTKTKTLPTVAALEQAWDRAIARGAESAELSKINTDLEAARRREADDARAAVKAEHDRLAVARATTRSSKNRKLAEAKRIGDQVDCGVFSVALDGEPLASVRVYPHLSVPGYEPVQYQRSKTALGVLFNAIERHAANRITNRRAVALGTVPLLSEDRTRLVATLRDMLRQSIAAGVVEIFG